MDVTFTDEQRDLRDVVRDVLGDRAPGEPDGIDPDLWKRLGGELGLAGLTVPERLGGAGGDAVDAGIVFTEVGAALAPVPVLQHTVAATLLGEAGTDPLGVLDDVAAGTLVAGCAPPGGTVAATAGPRPGTVRLTGTVDHVVDGPLLGLLLVAAERDGDRLLAAVRLPGTDRVEVTALPTMDRSRSQARITLSGADGVVVGDAAAAARAEDLLLTGVALECAGAARQVLGSTVGYLGERRQFGRRLGTFQALQHRCADLAVAVESASATAWYAAWSAAGDPSGLPLAAALAKAHCADVLRTVAGESIQLHGGIGFTWEHPAHRYFTRATGNDLLFGGRALVRGRLARHAGLVPG